jgi:hypothetical protein
MILRSGLLQYIHYSQTKIVTTGPGLPYSKWKEIVGSKQSYVNKLMKNMEELHTHYQTDVK